MLKILYWGTHQKYLSHFFFFFSEKKICFTLAVSDQLLRDLSSVCACEYEREYESQYNNVHISDTALSHPSLFLPFIIFFDVCSSVLVLEVEYEIPILSKEEDAYEWHSSQRI